jgi:serine/threonine protein kinase
MFQYCSHGTVHRNLQRADLTFGWNEAMHILVQTCTGLKALHTSYPAIVHRDIKTLNLLLDENWNVQICDFELALFMQSDSRNEESVGLEGTLAYTAPEVYLEGKYSAKSDIYSFGTYFLETLIL